MKHRRILLTIIPLAFLVLFYFYPMGKILGLSFSQPAAERVNLNSWKIIQDALSFTLFQAILSTALTLLIGMPSAYVFGRLHFPGKSMLRIASTLPFILPTVVVAAGFSSVIGPQGWLNLLLMRFFSTTEPLIKLQNTLGAILLAHVFYNTSIVIRVVGGAWAQLDPRLQEAAKTLGASNLNMFKKITLPLLKPFIISAILLIFLFNFTSFGVILMLGGPRFNTLEVEIYIQTMHFLNLPLAGILSIIQLIATMIVTFILMRVASGDFNISYIPKLKGEGQHQPEKLLEKLLIASTILVLGVLLILPLAGLVLRSVVIITGYDAVNLQDEWKIGLDYYRELFINRQQSFFFVPPFRALINSLAFAFSASLISLLLSLMLAFMNASRSPLIKILNLLVLLPLGTSAVTLGLGFFSAFTTRPESVRYYPLLLPAAHALIAMPFVIRVIQPALQSIPSNIKLAAQTLGASTKDIWRKIEIPIIWRALMTSGVYAFTISLGEFGATSFLARPDLPTLPVAIYRYLTLPGSTNYGQAMAMAVIILFVCGLSMFMMDQLQYESTIKK